MKKLVFLKSVELTDTFSRLYADMGADITCMVGYSEDLEKDAVDIYSVGEHLTTISVWDTLDKLSNELGLTITHYDVIEVGDEGDGFAFFF